MNSTPLRAYIVLAIGIFASSLAAIFIRHAQNEGVPSIVIAGGRVLLAALLLTPVALMRPSHREQIRHLRRGHAALVTAAGGFLALHFATWVSSLEYTTVLISVVLVSTTPIWAALLEVLVLKTRLSQVVIIGLIIVMLGGLLIGLSGGDTHTSSSDKPLLGAALSVAGAITAAAYMIIGRKLRPALALAPYIWMVYGVAAITLILMTGFSGETITGHSTTGYLWIVAMALFPQLTGHSSINYALAYLPATYVSLALQLEPILSTLFAYIIFSEAPGFLQIIGGIIIIAGVVLATLNNRELVLRWMSKAVKKNAAVT